MEREAKFEVTFSNGDKEYYTEKNLLEKLSHEGRLADSIHVLNYGFERPKQPDFSKESS